MDHDRRTERAVIIEYESLIDGALARDVSYQTLVAVAESAQSIKGYGPIKEAAVAAWRTRTAELLEPTPAVLA